MDKPVSQRPIDVSFWFKQVFDAIAAGVAHETLGPEDYLADLCAQAYARGYSDGKGRS